MVIIPESFSNLLPKIFIPFLLSLIHLRVSPEPCVIVSACIVMYIDYAVHAGIQDIIHNLIHTIHPLIIDFAGSIGMPPPCDRNPYCSKSGFPEHVHQFLCSHGLSPSGLPEFPVSSIITLTEIGIEGVAKIPADAHILHGFI